MIEVSKLHKMLKLESETAAAFDKMSKPEQQAYIKAHPASKYAHGGTSSVQSDATKFSKLAKKHGYYSILHDDLAKKYSKSNRGRAVDHSAVSDRFARSSKHYNQAAEAHNDGLPEEVKDHVKEARRHARIARSYMPGLEGPM
jgi:hypothetical protein